MTAPTVMTREDAIAARLVRRRRRPACCPASATSSWPATATAAIFSTRDFPYEATLVGLHGSLTPDEMLIPILVADLAQPIEGGALSRTGSGSGARETALARAAVRRRRWCWRQSTS